MSYTNVKISSSSSAPSFSNDTSKGPSVGIISVAETKAELGKAVVAPLRNDYSMVVATLRKRLNEIPETEDRAPRNDAEDSRVKELQLELKKSLKTLERYEEEKRTLVATIDGLNETLVEQRIKVAELKQKTKRYKREKAQLRIDLEVHMAEVNYLTKVGAPSSDPLVVRKIAKLERQNRELVAKYQRLLVAKRGSNDPKAPGYLDYLDWNTMSEVSPEESSELLDYEEIQERAYARCQGTMTSMDSRGTGDDEGCHAPKERRETDNETGNKEWLLMTVEKVARTKDDNAEPYGSLRVESGRLSDRKPPENGAADPSVGRSATTLKNRRFLVKYPRPSSLLPGSKLSSKYQVLVDIEPSTVRRTNGRNEFKSPGKCHRVKRSRMVSLPFTRPNDDRGNRIVCSLASVSALRMSNELIDAFRRWNLLRLPTGSSLLITVCSSSSQFRQNTSSSVCDKRLPEVEDTKCGRTKSRELSKSWIETTNSLLSKTLLLDIVVNVKRQAIMGAQTFCESTQTLVSPVILGVLKTSGKSKTADGPSGSVKYGRKSARRSVRFDPRIQCFCSETVDAKVACAKRTEFIQRALDLTRCSYRTRIQDEDPVAVQGGKETGPIVRTRNGSYSVVQTVYNCFV